MTTLMTVSFHGHSLNMIEHDGQPFVVMKPLVEGIGLSWQGQHKKLMANQRRWGINILLIPSAGGPQEAACLPLRKLPGYLMTIEPRKVPERIRPTVELFQAECDDALWDYWEKGVAINLRKAAPAELSELREQVTLLSAEHMDLLRRYIRVLERQRGVANRKQRASGWKNRPVTGEEVAEMVRRHREGQSLNAIGAALNRPGITVRNKLRAAGVLTGEASHG
jgi:hypothetical protein